MIRTGLTGGLASGKSFVGGVLAELGCHVIRADEVGHRVLEPDGEAFGPALELFGPAILKEDGSIDRKRLAAKVFGDARKLQQLNAIVHPAVFRMEEEFFEAIKLLDRDGIAIVEAAILIETGSYRRFDRLILAVCTVEQQIERAMDRGMSREDALLRIERQMTAEEKRKFADFVVDTSGSKAETISQTRAVYEHLRRLNK